eukprot:Skav232894  [mRNA]  locus=scaffold4134:102405:109879:- [translate_table: standard]
MPSDFSSDPSSPVLPGDLGLSSLNAGRVPPQVSVLKSCLRSNRPLARRNIRFWPSACVTFELLPLPFVSLDWVQVQRPLHHSFWWNVSDPLVEAVADEHSSFVDVCSQGSLSSEDDAAFHPAEALQFPDITPVLVTDASFLMQQARPVPCVRRQDSLLFCRGRPWTRAFVANHPFRTMALDVASSLRVNSVDVVAVFPVSGSPRGIPLGVCPKIVQFTSDLSDASSQVLVLIDVLLYPSGPDSGSISDIPIVRKVRKSAALATRRHILDAGHVHMYCVFQDQRCFVLHNGAPWSLADEASRPVHPADHFEIHVPPADPPITGCTVEDVSHIESAANPNLSNASSDLSTGEFPVSAHDWDPVDASQADEDVDSESVEPDPEIALDSVAPSLHFCVWAIVHGSFPRCNSFRVVHLGVDALDWLDRLRGLWCDVLFPAAPLSAHLVWPQPLDLSPPGSSHCIHILLEQNLNQARRAALISVDDLSVRPPLALTFALSVPAYINGDSLVRQGDLLNADRRSVIIQHWLQGRPLADIEITPCPAGALFRVRISPLVPDDGVLLMQVSSSASSSDSGVPTSSPPQATPSESCVLTSGLPLRSDLPVSLFALIEIWLQHVETEEIGAVATIETWYLHHTQMSVCVVPRAVELSSDVWSWEHSIIETWSDLFSASQPHQLYLVRPSPRPDPLRRRVAHVLLVQDPRDSFSAVLISRVAASVIGLRPDNTAVLVPRSTDRSSIVSVAFQDIHRSSLQQAQLCHVIHNGHQRVDDVSFQVSNGDLLETINGFSEPLLDLAMDPSPVFDPDATLILHNHHRGYGFAGNVVDVGRAFDFYSRPGEGTSTLLPVRTWFLDHSRSTWTTTWRRASLSLPWHSWSQQLSALWADHIDWTIAVEFSLVRPAPFPMSAPSPEIHIIVWQRPRHDRRVGLLYYRWPTGSLLMARSLPVLIDRQAILRYNYGVWHDDDLRGFTCEVTHGHLHLVDGSMLGIQDGCGIRIGLVPQSHWGSLTAELHAVIPTSLRQLLQHWSPMATVRYCPPETMSPVWSFFLHPDRHRGQSSPRFVSLSAVPERWVEDFRAAWSDLLDDHALLEFHLVLPLPTTRHVLPTILLSQNLDSLTASVLFYIEEGDGFTHAHAALLPVESDFESLHRCSNQWHSRWHHSLGLSVSIWLNGQPLLHRSAITLHHGSTVRILRQSADVADEVPPVDLPNSVSAESDSSSVLQLPRRVLSLEQLIPPVFVDLFVVVDSVHRLFSASSSPDAVSSWPTQFFWSHHILGSLSVLTSEPHARFCLFVRDQAQRFSVDSTFYVQWSPPTASADSERDSMAFLCSQGHRRAVIHQRAHLSDSVDLVVFTESIGLLQTHEKPPRLFTWPAPVSPQSLDVGDFWQTPQVPAQVPPCVIRHDLSVDYFASLQFPLDRLLCTDFERVPLPDFLQSAALQAVGNDVPDLNSFDRLVIYTDGSSIASSRHAATVSPSVADSWAFIVLGEKYGDSAPGKVSLIGWRAGCVCYDPEHDHFWGTSLLGSDQAEREALLWASFWRCTLGSTISTTFVSDSVATLGTCSGEHGIDPTQPAASRLRALCQCLEQGLGFEHISYHHTFGHCGHPWNELADFLATFARSLDCAPQWPVRFQDHFDFLPYWWMATSQGGRTAGLSVHGFSVPSPALPPALLDSNPPPESGSHSSCPCSVDVSFTSANVNSLYAGESGFSGKTAYLHAQFLQQELHFIGLQESRTPRGQYRLGDYLRLCSGAVNGALGLELWISLGRPYAWAQGSALRLQRDNIVVVASDARVLLCKVSAPGLNLWILVCHAPHSGRPAEEIQDWWSSLTVLCTQHGVSGNLAVLTDANASMGPVDGTHVVSSGTVSSVCTPFLRQFLDSFSLTIAGSLEVHRGTRDTWTTPDGLHSRDLDHVLLSGNLASCCCWSGVLSEVDIAGGHHDHHAISAQCTWSSSTQVPPSSPHQPKFDRSKIAHNTELFQALRQITPTPWSHDIETEVRGYTDALEQSLCAFCPPSRSGPKKPYISSEAWSLRNSCLQVTRQLRRLSVEIRSDLLRAVFSVWVTTSFYSDWTGSHIIPWPASYREVLQCCRVRLIGPHRACTLDLTPWLMVYSVFL